MTSRGTVYSRHNRVTLGLTMRVQRSLGFWYAFVLGQCTMVKLLRVEKQPVQIYVEQVGSDWLARTGEVAGRQSKGRLECLLKGQRFSGCQLGSSIWYSRHSSLSCTETPWALVSSLATGPTPVQPWDEWKIRSGYAARRRGFPKSLSLYAVRLAVP